MLVSSEITLIKKFPCELKNSQSFSAYKVKNTLGGLVPSVQFKKREKQLWRSEAWNFSKSITPPWVFSTFFKLYKWYEIAQSVSYTNQT